MQTLHRRQLPCAKALFLTKLAEHQAAMAAHALTVGVPAPFPEFDIMRNLPANVNIVQESVVSAAYLAQDNLSVAVVWTDATQGHVAPVTTTITAQSDPYLWALVQEWVAAGGIIAPFVVTPEMVRLDAVDSAIAAFSFGGKTLVELKAMDNATFDAWWSANVTTAAQAIQVLKLLARAMLRRIL